ncbi:MAG: hypothetical protein O7G85_03705 [Planctomycetota bacterium]|nr:hypothetical protein [Planctomycetota bacterium]
MNWRWLIYDYIPPEQNLSRGERRAVRKQVNAEARKMQRQSRILTWPFSFILVAGVVLGIRFLIYFFISQRYPVGLVYLFTFPIIVYLILALLWRYRYEKCTFRVLNQRGHPICLHCGYLLQGQPDDQPPDQARCPECGKE